MINPANYEAWLRDNTDWVTNAIALDYIDPSDTDGSAKRSFESFEGMLGRGVTTVPVYHQGEPIEWLERMLATGVDYIALSGTGWDRHILYQWYDLCFDRLTDTEGRPLVKLHCLGDTRFKTLTKYPWYSADSADWLVRALRTATMRISNKVQISTRNDNNSSRSMRGLTSLDPFEREAFDRVIKELGIEPAVFDTLNRENTQMRLVVEAFSCYRTMKEAHAKGQVRHKRTRGFFGNAVGEGTGTDFGPVVVYMVANGNWRAYPVLDHVGMYDTLQSFYYINTAAHAQFMRQWASDPHGTGWNHPLCAGYAKIMKQHLRKV